MTTLEYIISAQYGISFYQKKYLSTKTSIFILWFPLLHGYNFSKYQDLINPQYISKKPTKAKKNKTACSLTYLIQENVNFCFFNFNLQENISKWQIIWGNEKV